MEELKESLIRKALSVHKSIYPCNGKLKLEDCFTVEENRVIFWFNTTDRNTHALSADIKEPERVV